MIRIGLFGTINLLDRDGRELHGVLAQPKRLALLAYLAAAAPAGSHRRDTLLGLFWPELDQVHARNALSQAVHFLRRALGEATIVSRSAEELALDETLAWVDVRAFQAALAGDRPDAALELYRGDFLPSFYLSGCGAFEEWIERERRSLRQRAGQAARQLADRHERAASLTLAAGCAHRAIELSDGDERHLRHMIELLGRVGDRVGAMRAYERWTQAMVELGLEPEAETLALVQRMRAEPGRPPVAGVEAVPPASVREAVVRLREGLADRYQIEGEIGAGAMAVVVLARDLRHHRPVAIKILRPELTALMGAERFLREIEIAAGLVHPHILSLHDSGEAAGVLYYVMPYVAGESLRERLSRERRLPVPDAVRIAHEVAAALSYAHARGFVHRDIKPENILLGGYPPSGADGAGWSALVADFGIARAVGSAGGERITASLSGTPAYMSPEQVLGDGPVDAQTDVYALGCVLYEMLAGEPPHPGQSVEAVIERRLREPAPLVVALRSDVPPRLGAAVAGALAREPAGRFATATQFADALAGSEAPAAVPPPPRHPRALTTVAAALAAATALGALVLGISHAPGLARREPLQAVAVLPFRSVGDSGGGFFADGLAPELASGLVRLDGVAVRPAGTVQAEAAKGGGPVEIGRRLQAAWVLDGTVQRVGDRTRLVLELVSVGRGATAWTQAYETPATDLFAVRASATREVARALGVSLTMPVQAALSRRGTTDREAHDLYLRGSSLMESPDVDAARRAADLFGRAIQRDSTFAEAWVGLASAYQELSQVGGPTPVETLVLWRRAIDRAIALDSLNGEAYAQRAQVHEVFEWDFPAADVDFRRAIELSPGSAEAFMSYAQFLNVVGRDDSALVVMRRAVALSPAVSFRVANLAPRLRMVGRRAEAAAEAHRALALDTTLWVAHLMLAQLAEDAGRFGEAAREAEQARRFAGDLPFVLGTLARYQGISGHPERAESVLVRLIQLGDTQHVERVFRAEALIGVNNPRGALDALEQSARYREPDLPWKLAYGHFARLRGQARYQALLKQVGVGDHTGGR